MELCNGGRNVKDEDRGEILREIGELKRQKMDIEHRIGELEARLRSCSDGVASREAGKTKKDGLTREMIYRYSAICFFALSVYRSNLLKSSILVIGAGGLGSPAALYVVACGVGCLGIVDHDVVELNNLHRQLTVYNHNDGPCYRCLFPTPPPTAACQRCSDNGVLGVVPGVIGSLQALEAIKIASGVGDSLTRRMLLFDALSARMHIVGLLFLWLKSEGKSSHCAACRENAELTFQKFQEFDYEEFTQSPMSDKACQKVGLLPRAARISCTEYNERVLKREPHLLLDVRPAHHYKICALPGSLSIPLADLKDKVGLIHAALQKLEVAEGSDHQHSSLYVIC